MTVANVNNSNTPPSTTTSIKKPTKLKISKITKTSFKISWTKSKSKITGYEVVYSRSKKFKGKTTKFVLVGKKNKSKILKKLKKGKKYYVKVRAYKKNKGVFIFSKYTNKKIIKLKK